MARYLPWRHLTTFGLLALACAAICGSLGRTWFGSYVVAGLFILTAVVLFAAALRPIIEIHERHLRIGNELIPWNQVRRLDRTRWLSPLVVNIVLVDDRRIRLIYPSNLSSCTVLLRQMRRLSKDALIDGKPYLEYWGKTYVQPSAAQPSTSAAPPETPVDAPAVTGNLSATGSRAGDGSRANGPRRQADAPKYRLLRQEDEDEVIRLYQRLKAVGHMDPKDRADN